MMANIVSRTVTTPASQQYPKCPDSRHTHTVCQKVGTAHCSVPFQGGSPRGPSLPPGHQCLCRWQDPHLQFPKWELSEGDESQWQRLSCAVLLYSGQQVGGRCGGQSPEHFCLDDVFSSSGTPAPDLPAAAESGPCSPPVLAAVIGSWGTHGTSHRT